MNWHNKDSKQILELFGTSDSGLSDDDIIIKKEKYGPNELEEKKKKPVWLFFLLQFKDFMILVLMAAAIIAGIAGDITDTIIILAIVLINAVVGFIQEYRAEKSIEALKKIAALQAHVIRSGKIQEVPALDLVPGDLVLLEAGNVVPADIRLFETFNIRIDESALTGESVPVEKSSKEILEKDTPVADRINMAYKSTIVNGGRGTGIVVATGMKTEIGLIATMLQAKETTTPLQRRMADFGKKLSYIILLICLVLFGIGLLRGEEPLRMLLLSVSLAVAAIPEALPALITVALARGAKRLVKKNALIRKLPAVETLGSVTYICSDKTGTLTLNKMKVVKDHDSNPENKLWDDLTLLNCAIGLNHDVKKGADENLIGDPTEIAIVEYFINNNSEQKLKELQQALPRVAELPFDSDRKCMSTVHRYGNGYLIISKGAVESIASVIHKGDQDQKEINLAWQMSSEGIRVIAYATRVIDKLPDPFSYEMVEKDLVFAGLVGMIDPPREEVKNSIAECKRAGIRPVMITGDHPATAATIAREIGLLSKNELVISGKELKDISPEEYEKRAGNISVYARVSPEQKLKIVKTLQRNGHFVAMTGDGVNDAPSLKASDIGIAMGINGTDVSKEAADMILLDDNFTTIVKAVKEGRRIYDNIRRFVKYILTCNSAEIWTLFLAPLIGLPLPLLPIHILWINLVTDGLPGLALAGEKPEKGIMQRPPRKTNESLFAGGTGYHILWVGILMAGVTLGVEAWALNDDRSNWQTMVFTVLSLSQLGHVLAIRSDNEFVYQHGFFSNLFLIGAVLLTFLLQLAVIYLPYANDVFKTNPLSLNELLICIVLSAVVFHAVELEKYIKRRFLK